MANQHGYVVEPDREPRAVGIANILSGLVRASRPSSSVRTQPGLLAYRLNTPLLFVNARRLRDGIRAWVRGARPTVRVVLLHLSFTPELDIESVNVLASLRAELAGQGRRPVAGRAPRDRPRHAGPQRPGRPDRPGPPDRDVQEAITDASA